MTPNVGEDVEQQKLSFAVGGKQNGSTTLKDSLEISQKNKHPVPDEPATVLHGIYPKELKNYIPTKTYIGIFIEVLFIIAKTYRQENVI
jgi:hypothetical protein